MMVAVVLEFDWSRVEPLAIDTSGKRRNTRGIVLVPNRPLRQRMPRDEQAADRATAHC